MTTDIYNTGKVMLAGVNNPGMCCDLTLTYGALRADRLFLREDTRVRECLLAVGAVAVATALCEGDEGENGEAFGLSVEVDIFETDSERKGNEYSVLWTN